MQRMMMHGSMALGFSPWGESQRHAAMFKLLRFKGEKRERWHASSMLLLLRETSMIAARPATFMLGGVMLGSDCRQEESGGPPRWPPAGGKPLTAAERMMMKMGWKAGQGLGKQEQGITTPLMARKTDKRAGVIVNAPEKKGGTLNSQQPQHPQPQMQQQGPVQGSLPKGTPTRVVLLRNMVSAVQ